MARQLRIEFEGAFYHITSRGNLQERIFFEDRDKEWFLEILKRTKERYGYFLHAYALMDNHYHLLIETPYSNIKQIMQNINTSYTVYINTKYKRSGHLFQGRYKSIIIDKEGYLLELSRYVHLNPVRAKLVEMPYQYKWTSYREYLMKKGSKLVNREDTLRYFSKQRDEAIEGYREFVEGAIGKEIRSPFEDLEAGFILGKECFKKKIREVLIRGVKGDDEISALKEIYRVSIRDVIKLVAEYFNKEVKELTERGRVTKEREIAIYLSKVLSKARNIEVGNYFHIKGARVSHILKKIEKEITSSSKGVKESIKKLKDIILSKI